MIRNLIVCAVALFAGNLGASPVIWTVSGTFTDGGTVSGSFVFDAATTTVPSWNIHVAGGDTATFPAIDYVTGPVPVYYNNFLAPEIGLVFFDPNSTRRLTLLTTADLTNAGGVVSLVGFKNNSEFSGECYNCSPSRVFVEGGSLAGTPVSVDSGPSTPEPASVGLFMAGGAALAVRRWQKIRWIGL
ncbi:MAG: PEP-CTERM sorting domain-containing protein [Bryobacteraceae bacterium]